MPLVSKFLLSCCALVLTFAVARASSPGIPDLDALLAENAVPSDDVGVYIAPVSGARPVVGFNAERALNPASAIKVLPSLAALEILSPAHRWWTDVYKTGPVENGVLTGDLFIKGGGDPYLTVESFWALLKSVRAAGIDAIDGDIVVDKEVYDLPAHDRAAFDGKPYRAYNGPAGGLMVNFWSVRFTITANRDGVHIDAFPGSKRLKVVNNVKYSTGRCTRSRRYISYRVRKDDDAVTASFSGVLSSRCRPIVMSRAVIPVERYAAYVVPGLWRDAGGTLKGRVRSGRVPDTAEKIYSHPSRTLAEVVRATNKFSNNMMARHLLLSLASRDTETGISVDDGIDVLRDWLDARGIDVPGLKLVNGSGLSWDTRISARGMAAVLRAGYRSRYAPELMAALPVAGEDGALDERDFGEARRGVVRIKTGLIDHVRAMAGYVTARSGETYVVVLLVNHPGVHRGLGTRMQDAVIRYVLNL